jgi:tetratricopeptide (TPR) repeat protein
MEIPSSAMIRSLRYPQLAETWNNTGNVFKNAGRYDNAITCYDRAVDIDPMMAEAWLNKGFALQKLGREKEAQLALVTAMELDIMLADRSQSVQDLRNTEADVDLNIYPSLK